MAGKPFSEFGELSVEIKSVLASLGFTRATPVQEATIPLFSGNKDVAVDACTGSGKTLAFVVPVVEKLKKLEQPLKRHQVGAVIVSPTRELSRQIFNVALPFVAAVPWMKSALLVGGTDPSVDVSALKTEGAHVLIGTPGRLDDVLQRCTFLDLKTVEVLVLDEADRLLDMGFRNQLDALMARLPRQRRTGLFSATQTEAVEALARAGLRNPVRVAVAVTHIPQAGDGAAVGGAAAAATTKDKKKLKNKEGGGGGGGEVDQGVEREGTGGAMAHAQQVTPSTLSIQYTVVDSGAKVAQLAAFLAAHANEKIIVYFLTCACVDYFAVALPRLAQCKGLAISSLHGRMKQSARETTLEAFASAPAGALLATDVAARGLDIPDVHWVVQFDAPQDPSAFVHRCGRTARMGRSGNALAYLTPEELPYVDFLRVRKVPLTETPSLEILQDGCTTKHPGGADSTLCTLRLESEADRAVMESGTRAFVSYIRAYKEHHCKYIFRMEHLKLGVLASSFALLRLPRMQEVKKAAREAAAGQLEGFQNSEINPETVKFKDKAREKQRQATLKQRAAAAAAAEAEGRPIPSSKGGGTAQNKRQKGGEVSQPPQQQQSRLTAAKRRQLEARQEMVELNDEYTLLKRLKKGKISQREYDVATGVSSDDEERIAKGRNGQTGGSNATVGGTDAGNSLLSIVGGGRDMVAEAMRKKTRKAKKRKRKQEQQRGNSGDA